MLFKPMQPLTPETVAVHCLTQHGEVIGINSLKVSESGVEGLGFAIPSNEVVPLIKEMTENGHVERPYIGVGLANLNQVPGQYVQNLPTIC